MVNIRKVVSLPKWVASKAFPTGRGVVLVSEEGEGGVVKDNGYALVRYCDERNYLKGTIFLVTRQYCEGLSREYQVLDNSLEHFLLSRCARLVLYTHRLAFAFPSGMRVSQIQSLSFHAWHLQHGVDYFKKWDDFYDHPLERKFTKLALAYTEFDFLKLGDQRIDSLNCGQPRWDFLRRGGEGRVRKVLYAPTWRRILFSGGEARRREYNEMIEYVFDSLEGYEVELKVHRYADSFVGRRSSHLSYGELFGECDALLTDYSSVFADFQVMGKPVYLYAPDEEVFEKEGVGLLNRPSESVVEGKLNGVFPQMKSVILYAGGACEQLYGRIVEEMQSWS